MNTKSTACIADLNAVRAAKANLDRAYDDYVHASEIEKDGFKIQLELAREELERVTATNAIALYLYSYDC